LVNILPILYLLAYITSVNVPTKFQEKISIVSLKNWFLKTCRSGSNDSCDCAWNHDFTSNSK